MFKKISVTLVLGLAINSSFSQRETLNILQQEFARNMATAGFMEKIYTHIDKPSYVAGETIWFKTYIVDASLNSPSTVSKVAYAELLNENNEPVLQGKIAITNGSGSGSFYIPFTVPSGNYRFRAYTNWMKNFPADRYYEQDIQVINTLNSPPVEMISAQPDTTMEFALFPEGGNLVTGVESRVGFKLSDSRNHGLNGRGFIINQANDTVARFNTSRFGLGQFLFTPQSGQSYRAVAVSDSKTATAVVPQALNSGIVMSVTEPGNLLKVTVRSTADLVNQPVYLIAHNHHVIKSSQFQAISSGETAFLVDKNELGEGLSTITLFNSNRQPVAERMYFAMPSKNLSLEAFASQPEYSVRSNGTLQVNTAGGQPADLSIGIYRIDPLQTSSVQSISSYLWLSSELPGFIESPEYYLGNSPEVSAARENLLLTHGWRRFNGNESAGVAQSSFEFLPEYEGSIIMGKVNNKTSGQAAAKLNVYVAPVGGVSTLGIGQTDNNGKFLAVVKNYYGKSDLVIQSKQNPQDYLFEVNDPFSAVYSSRKIAPRPLLQKDMDAIRSAGINAQAQNIYLQDKLQQLAAPYKRDSTAFYGTPDGKFMLDKFTRFNTMEEVMREYVTAVNVRKAGGKFHYRVNNMPRDKFFAEDPLVLLDGVPVFNVDKIATYDPLKVWKIEVVHRQYLLNNLAVPGIVSYRTYENKMPGFELEPGTLVVNYEGLQMQREFYSPKYDNAEQKASRIPDFRSQLLWNGSLSQAPDGSYHTSFTTSDLKGTYIGVVQGITNTGLSGTATVTFTLK